MRETTLLIPEFNTLCFKVEPDKNTDYISLN